MPAKVRLKLHKQVQAPSKKRTRPSPAAGKKKPAKQEPYGLGDPLNSFKKELVKAFKFKTDEEWLDWLRSPLLMPWWIEFWDNCVKHAPQKVKPICFTEVQMKMEIGESYGRTKYSKPKPDTSNWEPVDHLARFIWNVKFCNLNSPKGVLADRSWKDGYMDACMWALTRFLLYQHLSWRIALPGCGTEIFGLKYDEVIDEGKVEQKKPERVLSFWDFFVGYG